MGDNGLAESEKIDNYTHTGHRARLRRDFLDGKTTDVDKLELLLASWRPRCDVRPVARRLMENFGSVYQILNAPIPELMKIKGVGEQTAILLKVVRDFKLSDYRSQMQEDTVFRDPTALSNYCKLHLGERDVEEFHIFYLNADMCLIMDETHSVGTLDWANVCVREIVKHALDLKARSVVFAHNHPASEHDFSIQDIDMTTQIRTTLNDVDVDVYDHILVAAGRVYSARNMFLLQ